MDFNINRKPKIHWMFVRQKLTNNTKSCLTRTSFSETESMSSLGGLLGSCSGRMGAAKLKSRHHKQNKEDVVMTSHFEFQPRSLGIILAEVIFVCERPSACDEIHNFKAVLIRLQKLKH